MLDTFRQDVRYAIRGLRRQPGFTAAVVVTLALGIGANAAMFGVTDRLLFRPPAFLTDADRVHRVYLVRTFDGEENFGSHIHYTRYKDLERWTSTLDATAAISEPEVAVGVGENAHEMRIGAVSAGYWSLFDVRPALGRFFSAAEDSTPVGASVVVLSYPLWQSRFGGRAALRRASSSRSAASRWCWRLSGCTASSPITSRNAHTSWAFAWPLVRKPGIWFG